MSGIERIARERQRQIDKEQWSAEHDDEHRHGEIAMAAAVYAMTPTERANEILRQNLAELLWPWDWGWFKPGKKGRTIKSSLRNRIRELEKAGALCAAEIDRLERLEAAQDA